MNEMRKEDDNNTYQKSLQEISKVPKPMVWTELKKQKSKQSSKDTFSFASLFRVCQSIEGKTKTCILNEIKMAILKTKV